MVSSSRTVEPAIAETPRSGATVSSAGRQSNSQMKEFDSKSLQALARHEAHFCEVWFGVDEVPRVDPDLIREAKIL